MNLKKLIKQVICLALVFFLVSDILPTIAMAKNYEKYTVDVIVEGRKDTTQLEVLNVNGSAYLSVDEASRLSGMAYIKTNSGDYVFSKGQHHITYKGQIKEVDGVTYLRMQNAMDQLSCRYVYSSSLQALIFEPTDDFVENLCYDCNAVFDRFDLTWVKEVPGAKTIPRLYRFFTNGWDITYLWGADQRNQYEETIWGIIVPKENESTLLNIADDGNNAVDIIHDIVEFSDKNGTFDIAEIEILVPEDFKDTYDALNKTIPGMSISDYLKLIERAYGSQYASTLYVNAVKYGFPQNSIIEDMQLNAALENISKYFDGKNLLLKSFIEDWVINFAESGIKDLSVAALEEALGYKNIAVKMFSHLVDHNFDMKKNTGTVLTLLDCAEIQQEAIKQYQKSKAGLNSKKNILAVKYSTILYLRACEYGYEQYKSSGDVGAACYEMMQPSTSAMIQRIASYSDDELTREICNKNLDFSLKGFSLINSKMQIEEVRQFSFNLNTSNNFEDYITFSPNKSGWYTFSADGTGYFWMEAPNREMTEYRLDGHVFSEYGLHYYLSENQQYYIKICSNSEANGKLYVAESQFPSLTEGETLQLPLADCYGGFDGGGYAINYFSFTPSSSGIYYFSCGPKDIFTRSATWGIARDAFGNGIQIISTTANEAGITTMEYQLISGNTYYFGLSASPGGICNITVSSSPNESGDKTDNLLLSNFPDEFMYTSGVGAWMTVINLEQNGAFTGIYHDTNAGETGNDYPNGTTYICGFSGEFTDFEKVNEYTYTTSLSKILMEKAPGEVYYEDGVRYITTDPYGFTNADVFYMYLPGTPYSAISERCSEWFIHYNLTTPLPSDTFVLYNVNGGEVFIGNIDIPTDSDGRNYKVLESDISGVITDITGKLNIRSGPGTSYEVVGYLLPNDTVEVYETAHNEEVTWGHIEQGWISMDYVGNITHRNSANTIYAENYVDYTTAEILAELGPEYDIPGAYAGSYLLKTINYPDFYFAYNNDNSTSQPYITGFESVVCIYVFGDAAINEYLSANMSKMEIDEAVNNPDVLSSSTDTFYMALDNTGNVFQYVIETHKAYISYEWYLDSGSSTNAPADSVCVSPK